MKDSNSKKCIESSKEVAKEIYRDLAKPTVKAIGNIISLPFRAIDAALTPMKKWIDNKNFNYEQTRNLLAEKLKNVDESKIVEPEAFVAVPALQQLAYSYDSEDLRKMYANLLASAMMEGTKNKVHPSFVDIIKQLSPFDARALSSLNTYYVPIITATIEDQYKKIRHDVLVDYCMDLIDIYPDECQQASSLQNLKRLGLINITYEKIAKPSYRYDKFFKSEMFQNLKRGYDNSPYEKLIIKKGVIEFTFLGLDFCKICSNNNIEISD